uniref:AIG1-type G domain-containing protein n=1 Tax=Amphimedon queenslandica TaxID=400682 RepID=A0A1X7UF99_AMPQE
MMASSNFKIGARILVVGYNGSGKSSLINKLAGNNNLAIVGDDTKPTQHESLVMKFDHELDPAEIHHTIPVVLFDTQGFGDTTNSDREIADAIVANVKKIDAVLICHKLYQRVDHSITAELEELTRILGNELAKHAIIVFTHGDEYAIKCKPKNLPKNEIAEKMMDRAQEIKEEITKNLKSEGQPIKKEIADNIPYCITSAEEDELPTGMWIDKLWETCEKQCKPEAAIFITYVRKHVVKDTLIGGSVGGAGGAVAGATVGALIGTGAIPVVGTALGAAIGVAFGSLFSGVAIGAAIGAGVGYAKEKNEEARMKKNN